MTNIRLPTKNGDIVIVMALLALSCVFFYKVLLNPGGIIFDEYFSDVLELFLPYKSLVHETWQSFGQLPLWNPYTFMGTPAIGNVLYALFNPYNVLFMFFDPAWLFGALFLVDVFVIGVSTYFFTKSIGINRFGALVAAITFMFSGAVVARVYAGHPANLDIMAMAPLAFMLLERAIQKKSISYAALAGVPIALQLVGGNIQVALYGLTALGIYFIIRLFSVARRNPRDAPRMVAIMAVACVMGIALSAVQFIPAFELSINSVRNVASSIDYETATAYSFPPEQTVTFLMPEFFGTYLDYTYWGGRNFWELCAYTGVFSIVLAVASLLGAKNEYKLVFLALLVFSFLFALGRYTPFYSAFYYMPFFSIFRKPSVMMFITSFSLSVLAGFGADMLSKPLDPKIRKRLSLMIKAIAVLSVAGLVVTLSAYVLKDAVMSFGMQMLISKYEYFTTHVHTLPYELDFYIDKIPEVYAHILYGTAALVATLAAITALLHARIAGQVGTRLFQLAVVLIVLADLWWFGMKYVVVADTADVFRQLPAIEFLKTDSQKFRVVNVPGAIPPYMLRYNDVETISGYEPVQMLGYGEFMTRFFGAGNEETGYSFSNIREDLISNNTKILGLLNVKYIMTQNTLESPRLVLKESIETPVYVKSLSNIEYKSNRGGYMVSDGTTQLNIYENADFLPRAFVAGSAKVEGGNRTLDALASAGFDPARTVILEEAPGVPLGNAGTHGQANITYYSPNEIRLQVQMDGSGFLVLSENYYPGWTATDNGATTEVYRADYILRAIYLGEGAHAVVLKYDPASLRIGASITTVALLVLCTFVLYMVRFRMVRGVAK